MITLQIVFSRMSQTVNIVKILLCLQIFPVLQYVSTLGFGLDLNQIPIQYFISLKCMYSLSQNVQRTT